MSNIEREVLMRKQSQFWLIFEYHYLYLKKIAKFRQVSTSALIRDTLMFMGKRKSEVLDPKGEYVKTVKQLMNQRPLKVVYNKHNFSPIPSKSNRCFRMNIKFPPGARSVHKVVKLDISFYVLAVALLHFSPRAQF